MPPKKKEEQIDLSTLPECTHLNNIILTRGKKSRATAITQLLQQSSQKFMFKIKKSQVLDHAKDKNMYVDPNTLNQKQKKDPKFMQSINTEITAEIVANATKSLIATLIVKARMEKKNSPEDFAGEKRKFDVMYVLDDFPETQEEFQALAAVGEGVKYVLVTDPKITWSSAPEMPEEESKPQPGEGDEEEGPEQEDEDVKEYRKLLKKEEKSEQDTSFESEVDKRIDCIRKFRSQANKESAFRQCAISYFEPEIDPYSQENSLNETVKGFFEKINQLETDYCEFQEWKKDKQTEAMPETQKAEEQRVTPKGSSLVGLLDCLARGFDEADSRPDTDNSDKQALQLIESFSLGKKKRAKQSKDQKKEVRMSYLGANEEIGPDSTLQSDLRKQLKYPGINRFQMPQTPTKSEGLRKCQQAHYAQFLKGNISEGEFFRRQRITNFQQFIKEFDEERTYSFADRIYEERHGVDSLKRELYSAMEGGEAAPFVKYDQNTDKLYLMMVYKSNARRVAKRNWESSWKVVPNYQCWLKYFKSNEGNLGNSHFYDLDYEKIGNIQEVCRSHTLQSGSNGAVIVTKECSAGNKIQKLLYSVKNDLTFGVGQGKFYCQKGSTKIYHQKSDEQQQIFETVAMLATGRVRVSSKGNVVFENGTETRMVTPQGYTIIFKGQKSTILHPNGGITNSADTYVNERGFGLKQGHLHASLSLEKTAANGKILKREDGTVIVNKEDDKSKWIRFPQGTEYQVNGGDVRMEKKGLPNVLCVDGQIQVITDQFTISVFPGDGCYQSSFQFKDGSNLNMNGEKVTVGQREEKETIEVNVTHNNICSVFGDQQVSVCSDKASYKRQGKVLDAWQDEEKYGQQQILPGDYIQPRLFVMNCDNTGVQLLNQEKVDLYLSQHQACIQKVYQTIRGESIEVTIVSKINKKGKNFIKNKLQIKLDVFDNTAKEEVASQHDHVTFRTLLRYSALTPQDIAKVHDIKSQVETWRKANLREQNQFGHKAKDQAALKAKIESRLLATKMRQKKEPLLDALGIMQRGQKCYEETLGEMKNLEEQKSKQARIRSQYMNKRQTIVQHFKPVQSLSKQRKQKSEEIEVNDSFLDNYFLTSEGRKALEDMPEWVFRPKDIKERPELDQQIQNELNNTNNLQKEEEMSEQARERYDTVEVELNPRGEKEIYIKPSVFTQRDIDQERVAFQVEKKAYKYHEVKRKDYNVYGEERRRRPEVRALMRTQAISQINQKYLVTEAPLDKKVKTSSMKNKLSSSASNMIEMRKEGPHNLLMKTLDKGNDIGRMLEKRTMMVQADLNDKLQRDVLINPVQANFGVIMEKKSYELRLDIKNEDVISQRVTVRRPRSIFVKVALSQMGPIAMGMSRKIIVTIKTSPQILGKFTDEFDVVTKHEIYHIPISAHIVSDGQGRTQSMLLSRGVTELQETRKKMQGSIGLPPIK